MICEHCKQEFMPRGVSGPKRLAARRFCGNRCAMLHKRSVGVVTTTKHGQYKAPEYGIWSGMHQRCSNPKNSHFAFYGGRGIRVCAEWTGEAGFESFLAHVGPRPSPLHTIDRYPDTNGNYEPGNVRWATKKEQQRNLRTSVTLTLDGETLTVAEWAERHGIDAHVVGSRLRLGWEPRKALTAPLRVVRRRSA